VGNTPVFLQLLECHKFQWDISLSYFAKIATVLKVLAFQVMLSWCHQNVRLRKTSFFIDLNKVQN
jgi:hypothetical protein